MKSESLPGVAAPTPGLNCKACSAQCCRYFALQIDTPSEPGDFENIRWYLAHREVAVFIEGDDWYLQVNNACRYLQADAACGIYARRPQICRDYGLDAEGHVECHESDRPCDHDYFFSSPEELEVYLLQQGKK